MPNYITIAGLEKIREELRDLLHVQRPDMVKQVSVAAAHGDRSENAEYKYGKMRLREIDRRIRYLETRLDDIEIVDPKKVSTEKITFGATVTVVDQEDTEAIYQIVGEDELEAKKGKISWKSPMAKALLGKRVGDVVKVVRPKGDVELEILKIEAC